MLASDKATVLEKYDEYCVLRSGLAHAIRQSTTLDKTVTATNSANKPAHVIVGGRVSLELADKLLYQHSSSPERNNRIYLEALAVSHVEEAIDHYELWPAAQAGLPELRYALAASVRNATAGCPRPMHFVLSIIKTLRLDISNPRLSRQP